MAIAQLPSRLLAAGWLPTPMIDRGIWRAICNYDVTMDANPILIGNWRDCLVLLTDPLTWQRIDGGGRPVRAQSIETRPADCRARSITANRNEILQGLNQVKSVQVRQVTRNGIRVQTNPITDKHLYDVRGELSMSG